MEAEHSETIVDKAVAYVKDMLGMPPADRPPDVVANPEYSDTAPELTSEDAMRLDPHAYAFSKIVERSRRSTATAGEIADTDSAVEAHTESAAQVDRAKGSAEEALHEIQDVSRGMRETNPENTRPSESEMDEIGRSAEKDRQAQQHSAGW